MLVECFLTPETFSDLDGTDGAARIDELTHAIFPRRTVPVVLICKLGAQEWERATSKIIARLKNQACRNKAMALFRKLQEQVAVERSIISDSPINEEGWVCVGLASHANLPFEAIVVSSKMEPPTEIGKRLDQFSDDSFWLPFPNPRFVKRDLDSQRSTLRSVCAHSDWMVVRMPQIRGGIDDEIVTVKQIIELTKTAPCRLRRTAIDLHICSQEKIDDDKLLRNVTKELESVAHDGCQIQLTLLPRGKILNREIIAGTYKGTSSKAAVRKPLWLLTMAHVAVAGRRDTDRGRLDNSWNLFARRDANERLEAIEQELPLNSLAVT